jgi:hypothetical protein
VLGFLGMVTLRKLVAAPSWALKTHARECKGLYGTSGLRQHALRWREHQSRKSALCMCILPPLGTSSGRRKRLKRTGGRLGRVCGTMACLRSCVLCTRTLVPRSTHGVAKCKLEVRRPGKLYLVAEAVEAVVDWPCGHGGSLEPQRHHRPLRWRRARQRHHRQRDHRQLRSRLRRSCFLRLRLKVRRPHLRVHRLCTWSIRTPRRRGHAGEASSSNGTIGSGTAIGRVNGGF